MTVVRILDNEMVSVLRDPSSPKHKKAMSRFEADRGIRRKRRPEAVWIVPSTVRVEAEWDRSSPAAAVINRLGIVDHHLDERAANAAARLRAVHGVSPADAHVGAVITSRAGDEIIVFTSDDADIEKVRGTVPARIIHV